ncbi:MAG: invasion associated locus B family protein [Bauldia sp.]|nr:invasion associated locus B family protein [Bauldia sp.]
MLYGRGKLDWRLTAAASALVLIGLGPALAQGQAQSESPRWIKVCNPDPESGLEGCLVVQQIFAANGSFIASADVRWLVPDNGGTPTQIVFVAAVPAGMLIQPGVRIEIDSNTVTDIPFEVCYAAPLNRCYARVEINAEFVNRLKAGNEMSLLAISYENGRTLSFPMTLAGFTAAYDGAPTDLGAAEAALANDRAAADAARQRLIDLQNQQNAPQ